MVIAAAAPDGKRPQGHCSRCGKIWTQNEGQGVCQWCNKPASCETTTAKPRHIKSNRRRRQTQANGNGNGYDQLPEPHLTYYMVASKHAGKGKAQDREDLLHTIYLTLAVAERNNGHKPFTLGTMHRIASRAVFDYWRAYHRLHNGLDCHSCSKAQRQKCKEDVLYTECPKAIKLESLDKPILDSEGNLTTLGDLIADPDSLDPDFWDRDSLWQLGYKPRMVAIANKLKAGEALANYDMVYLARYRKQAQKKLFQ
jgi:DNA-directed RNA polymerase specialized sigma24 family protein